MYTIASITLGHCSNWYTDVTAKMKANWEWNLNPLQSTVTVSIQHTWIRGGCKTLSHNNTHPSFLPKSTASSYANTQSTTNAFSSFFFAVVFVLHIIHYSHQGGLKIKTYHIGDFIYVAIFRSSQLLLFFFVHFCFCKVFLFLSFFSGFTLLLHIWQHWLLWVSPHTLQVEVTFELLFVEFMMNENPDKSLEFSCWKHRVILSLHTFESSVSLLRNREKHREIITTIEMLRVVKICF